MRQVGDPPLVFSEQQRRDLARLQVTPEQIQALEDVLPQCRAMLRDDPPLNEVRAELKRLHAALVAAETELVRFESLATRDFPAAEEAFTRVGLCDPTGAALDRARESLSPAIHAIERAQRRLPTEQRRRHRAAWKPVAEIAEALEQGWTSSLPLPHVPSEGVRLPFRSVVAICYQTLGSNNADPLRAIRGYLAHLLESRKRQTRDPQRP
jgi:hypothetical protein